MVLNFTEASSLAIIDRQIEEILDNISPAQYEIVRRVIYKTADFEYQSILKFSEGALAKGASALTAVMPIIVDVPEIQVSIVPKLQKTFGNSVYCCRTTPSKKDSHSKAAGGLEILGSRYPNGIFIIGQDQEAMIMMVELLKNQIIKPSLAIATPPMFIESDIAKPQLKDSYIPSIWIDSSKGGSNVAAAIFNALINLVWQAERNY